MVHLWDIYTDQDYSRLRVLAYPQTDVFLLCFSITDQASFHNIQVTVRLSTPNKQKKMVIFFVWRSGCPR